MSILTEKERHAILHDAKRKRYYFCDQKQKFKGKDMECTVYVGNLPSDFLLAECLTLMRTFGRVYKVRMMIERCAFDCSNGHAIVTYHYSLDADKASEQLDNCEIRKDIKLKTILARRQRQIIVGRIPFDISENQVREIFSETFHGLKSIELVKLKSSSRLMRTKHTGYAILEFATHIDGVNAKRFVGNKSTKFWDTYLIANWIEPGKAHRHVIITGIPKTISEFRIMRLLRVYSNDGLDNYKWHHETLYVEFHSNLHAERAFKKLQGFNLDGNKIHVQWNVFPS